MFQKTDVLIHEKNYFYHLDYISYLIHPAGLTISLFSTFMINNVTFLLICPLGPGGGRVLMSAQNVVFLDGSIKGARKKNAFFADASAKTLTPRERRNEKMDDFERKKKTSVLKENFNILRTDTLAKSSLNIFAYSFVSEHSKHFFLTCFLSVH